MAQSLNLLPFYCAEPFAPIAIPAQRTAAGQWEILDYAAIRTAGFVQTARRFQAIDRAIAASGVVKPLAEKINERNKLTIQVFPDDGYLVLSGAGGGVSCAACLRVGDHQDVIIHQTLYWRPVSTSTEAWYQVGLLNSDAITEATRPFNPQGELGPRHLHTLPHRVIPQFDSTNEDHQEIARLSERLAAYAAAVAVENQPISDLRKAIASRRSKLRKLLHARPELDRLEWLCAAVLGTTPGSA